MLNLKVNHLTKQELIIVENEIFALVVNELPRLTSDQMLNFNVSFHGIKNQEKVMPADSFLQFVLRDLVASGEYTVLGIARYTGVPEEVVFEVVAGRNTNPSWGFVRKVIDLHRLARRELYQFVVSKIFESGKLPSPQN